MSVAYVSSKNVNDIRNKGIKYILFSISVTQNVVAGIGQHNGVMKRQTPQAVFIIMHILLKSSVNISIFQRIVKTD